MRSIDLNRPASMQALPAAKTRQLRVFGALLISYSLLAVASLFVPGGSSPIPDQTTQTTFNTVPMVAALGAGIALLYGLVGLLGWWVSQRAGLPGIVTAGATWRQWVRGPLTLGLGVGVILVAIDATLRLFTNWDGFPHPSFPLSLLASYTAAVGEEILFRLFFFSLWYAVLRWLFQRWLTSATAHGAAALIANVLAALAFAAGHLGTAMVLYDVAQPADLPTLVLTLLVLLNGIMGIAAGWSFLRAGLVGAVGVHLGADLVWHVLYGLAG